MMLLVLITCLCLYFFGLYFVSIRVSGKSKALIYESAKPNKWWAVAIGLIGTTISGITFVSVPGLVSTSSGMSYFQFVLGNFVGFIIIAYVLLPLYYKINLNSIYTYIGGRFGQHSHKTTAWLFICSRTVGTVFRLYLGCLVLQVVLFDRLHIPFVLTSVLLVAVLWLYTRKGGIQNIIWTDFFQTILLMACALFTFVYIAYLIDIPILSIFKRAGTDPHATIIVTNDFFGNKNHVLKQFFAGIVMTIAMVGLDQDMMQKNLKLKNIEEAQRNYIWFALMFVVTNFFFLCLGFLFYVFMDSRGLPTPSKTDIIYPYISENYLGLAGMVCFVLGMISATFSSCASSLISITSAYWLDIKGKAASANPTKQSKHQQYTHAVVTLIFLVGNIVFYEINKESVVTAMFKIAGYTYGPLLAIFCLGLLSKVKPIDTWTPYIAITAVVITAFLDMFSQEWLYGYKFGFEILLLNACIAIVGFVLSACFRRCSLKKRPI